MKRFSQGLSIVVISSVHPNQARPSLTPPANLYEDEVTCLARPPHLVPVPGDHWAGVVCGADDVQLAHGDIRDAAPENENVQSQDALLGAYLLREDVHRPN